MNLIRVLNPPKTGFNWASALNLETINTILSGINHIWASSQIWTAAKFLKFGLSLQYLGFMKSGFRDLIRRSKFRDLIRKSEFRDLIRRSEFRDLIRRSELEI